MVNYVFSPTPQLSGELFCPGDKSISHRALMLASLSDGPCQMMGLNRGEDVLCTIQCLRQLGIEISDIEHDIVTIQGKGLNAFHSPTQALYCGNSGTSMRLLCGLLAGSEITAELTGDPSLSRRPMARVITPLSMMGAKIIAEEGHAPLQLQGSRDLNSLTYQMPMASAQVKSTLLLAGLFAQGVTTITEPTASRDHTERLLSLWGYPLSCSDRTISIEGGHRLRAHDLQVPGDLSAAAFFIVAATLIPGSEILLRQIGMNPGRTGIIKILQKMGADITVVNSNFFGKEPVADLIIRAHPLRGIHIESSMVASCIDEFPILMVAAAAAKGSTRIQGAAELRVKESDRIAVMVAGLRQLGIVVEEFVDGAFIQGGQLQGGTINAHGDHRIAMAFSVAGALSDASVCVEDCEAIETSYPNFAEAARHLGMQLAIQPTMSGV